MGPSSGFVVTSQRSQRRGATIRRACENDQIGGRSMSVCRGRHYRLIWLCGMEPKLTRVHALCSQCARARFSFVPLFVVCAMNLAFAQPARVTTNVPVRELSIREKSPQVFANIFQVREIANQQILVNDGLRRHQMNHSVSITFWCRRMRHQRLSPPHPNRARTCWLPVDSVQCSRCAEKLHADSRSLSCGM